MSRSFWTRCILGWVWLSCFGAYSAAGSSAALVCLASSAQAQEQDPAPAEPALPVGLEPPIEPDLPAGLGSPSDPDLPEGLEPPTEPDLPIGLGQPPEDGPDDDHANHPGRTRGDVRFWLEGRVGARLDDDPAIARSLPLAEIRAQLAYQKRFRGVVLDLRTDWSFDAVSERGEEDLRQLSVSFQPSPAIDLRIGRQILSWGTGDLLFINDLFPKDWQAFFIGRDTEYLKAPSDAIRLGWFRRRVAVDVVYSPQFDPDRFLTGERLSIVNPANGERIGSSSPIKTLRPDRWFRDSETAIRIHGLVRSLEWAIYGYRGFWKSPAGLDPAAGALTFPALAVYGASGRGPVAGGIGSAEVGYYHSKDDSKGDNPLIENSQFRLLLGYERDLGNQWTGAGQLYGERRLNHGTLLRALPNPRTREPDPWRTLATLRLHKLLRRQTVELSFFTFYSPSDRDGYFRSAVRVTLDDHQRLEIGGNLFFGSHEDTMFGQLEDSSNLYIAWRFSR